MTRGQKVLRVPQHFTSCSRQRHYRETCQTQTCGRPQQEDTCILLKSTSSEHLRCRLSLCVLLSQQENKRAAAASSQPATYSHIAVTSKELNINALLCID